MAPSQNSKALNTAAASGQGSPADILIDLASTVALGNPTGRCRTGIRDGSELPPGQTSYGTIEVVFVGGSH